MFKSLAHSTGLAIARFLSREVERGPLSAPPDFDELRRTLRPGDILLVEGRARVSGSIKYLTQSTWSHAAMFVGGIPDRAEANGEPHVLVEALLDQGVCSSPLSKYRLSHTRICRPVHLSEQDLSALIAYVSARIGYAYDLRNVFDLLRYLAPLPHIPVHLRRRLIAAGSAAPTRAICSTLIAEAFQSVRYPILPIIEMIEEAEALATTHRHAVREIMHIRESCLYTPRDFDISPYFEVIKPAIACGFDYRRIDWA